MYQMLLFIFFLFMYLLNLFSTVQISLLLFFFFFKIYFHTPLSPPHTITAIYNDVTKVYSRWRNNFEILRVNSTHLRLNGQIFLYTVQHDDRYLLAGAFDALATVCFCANDKYVKKKQKEKKFRHKTLITVSHGNYEI